VLHIFLRLRGGGSEPVHEMTVAAGGKIKQVIAADYHNKNGWLPSRTTVFNVQILNTVVYKAVTGEAPPTRPMGVKEYKKHGFPFFKMYEEPSGVSGNFSLVKSIAEIDENMDNVVTPRPVIIGSSVSTGFANPQGPFREFRTVTDLEEEMEGVHVARF
jgi:hypothetical protein